MTASTITCPTWCTDHDDGGHDPDDGHQINAAAGTVQGDGAGELLVELRHDVTDPDDPADPRIVVEGSVDLSATGARRLAGVLLELADLAEADQ